MMEEDERQAADALEEAVKVIRPFSLVGENGPADATDDDYAAIRFRDFRAARDFLVRFGG